MPKAIQRDGLAGDKIETGALPETGLFADTASGIPQWPQKTPSLGYDNWQHMQ
jgi:hypothetical protein